MNIKRDYTKISDENSEGYLTIMLYASIKNSFTFNHPDTKNMTKISFENTDSNYRINLDGTKIPHILNIFSSKEPLSIKLDGENLVENSDWTYRFENDKIIIKTLDYKNGNYVINFKK